MCADARTVYDSNKADAERIGCAAQYNTAISCSSGGNFCDNARCNTETNALVACISAYCMTHADDRVCTG